MNSDNDKNYIFEIIQKYLQNPPVIIWGSGATIPFGMPSMSILNDEIDKEFDEFDGSSNNLEEELGKEKYVDILPDIRKFIWEKIRNDDEKNIHEILCDINKYGGIYKLIKKCIETAPKVMNIITTNYDRILEHVMSYYNISYTDGFNGKYLSLFDENAFKDKDIVNLIKVHGSLNWGKLESDIRYITCKESIEPVIIPPGKNKYQETYHTPYRELIQFSDRVIKNANSFMVVGFGFNDEHITPKIKEKVEKGIPLVLITKSITSQTKIELNKAKKLVLIEENTEGKSHIFIKRDNNEENYYIDGNYWQLDKFMEEVL